MAKFDNGFYSTNEWKDFRKSFLALHPVCSVVGCGGKAKNVDHIKSRASGGASFDVNNCRALCWSCHSRKTAQHDGGFGRAAKTGEYKHVAVGCDDLGNPRDSNHHWNK